MVSTLIITSDEDMISIASYMSTTSSANSNPYLNSNRIKYSSDSENDEILANDSTTYFNQTKNLFEMADENDDDDMDSYFKLDTMTPSKVATGAAFNNSIEHHFKNLQGFQKPPETPPTIRSDPNDSTMVVAPVIRSVLSTTLDSTPTISAISSMRKKFVTTGQINKLNSKLEQQKQLPNYQKLKVASEPKVEQKQPVHVPLNPFNDDDSVEPLSNPFESKAESKKSPVQNKDPSSLEGSKTSKELLVWSKRIIDNVKTSCSNRVFEELDINDFSSSWSNGLAFCAIIYYFRPDLM